MKDKGESRGCNNEKHQCVLPHRTPQESTRQDALTDEKLATKEQKNTKTQNTKTCTTTQPWHPRKGQATPQHVEEAEAGDGHAEPKGRDLTSSKQNPLNTTQAQSPLRLDPSVATKIREERCQPPPLPPLPLATPLHHHHPQRNRHGHPRVDTGMPSPGPTDAISSKSSSSSQANQYCKHSASWWSSRDECAKVH